MKKRLSVLMVLVLMMVTLVSFVSAEELPEDFDFSHYGKGLEKLGVLKGTDKGLELDSELTRIQGMVIYFRLLGYEGVDIKELGVDTKHPFTDVPKWANTEVGVLYNLGLVKGISETKLGSNDKMTIEQFTTLMLRALGYNDSEGDFVWDKSVEKFLGEMLNLEEDEPELYKYIMNKEKFTRGDMSYIALQTLYFNVKGSDELLIDKLGIEDVITYKPIVKISDEDEEKIPEDYRLDIYYAIEHDYSEEYDIESIDMYDVEFTQHDVEKFDLDFKLDIIYKDKDELKNDTKIIHAEFEIDDDGMYYDLKEKTNIKISGENEEKIPENIREDVYFNIEYEYKEKYDVEDITIYDVNVIDGEFINLELKIKVLYDEEGEIKELDEDIIMEVEIDEEGIIYCCIIDKSVE